MNSDISTISKGNRRHLKRDNVQENNVRRNKRKTKKKKDTTIVEKTIKKLRDNYYNKDKNGTRDFKEFMEMEKITTMNMTIFAYCIKIIEDKKSEHDSDKESSTMRKYIKEIIEKLGPKSEIGEASEELMKIRLRSEIEAYIICIENYLSDNNVETSFAMKQVFEDE